MTLNATITMEAAAQRTWEVVIVGAGPAGSVAARELALLGVSVLLVDRAFFPRWKVCGCCLNSMALSLLKAVGLRQLAALRDAVPLDSIVLNSGGHVARLLLNGGVALSRESFDAALIEAAVEAGAGFLPETRAQLPSQNPEGQGKEGLRRVDLHKGGRQVQVAAGVVLAADGLARGFSARTASAAPAAIGARIGAGTTMNDAPAFYRPGVVYMACGGGGDIGMVRLEDNRLDVAAAFDAAEVRAAGGPGAAAVRIIQEAGWPAPAGFQDLSWRGTPPLTRQAQTVGADRLFVIGDAAGYVEPFTGEGMAWALASGIAVAPLAAAGAKQWRPQLIRQWAALHRRVVTRRQTVCRTAAAVLRRPWLTRLFIRLLSRRQCWRRQY